MNGVDFEDIDHDNYDYSPVKLHPRDDEVCIPDSIFGGNGNPCAMFAWWAVTRLFILTTQRFWRNILAPWLN